MTSDKRAKDVRIALVVLPGGCPVVAKSLAPLDERPGPASLRPAVASESAIGEVVDVGLKLARRYRPPHRDMALEPGWARLDAPAPHRREATAANQGHRLSSRLGGWAMAVILSGLLAAGAVALAWPG